MAKTYGVINGPAPGAAATPKVATTGAIKTMLQLSTAATREARIITHMIEMDGSAAAVPVQYELIRVASGAATVTAFVAADIAKLADPNSVAPLVTLGVSNSGYSASAEGTPVTPVTLEQHLVPPTSGIYIQLPVGREFEIAPSTFLRQRVTAPATVNAICGVQWEE